MDYDAFLGLLSDVLLKSCLEGNVEGNGAGYNTDSS